jgi:putative transport protein
METLTELLHDPTIAFFAIVAIGLTLGNISVKGVSLGDSAIIFVALAFGHYGVSLPPMFRELGLILFVYSVGIQAGPGFFDAFRKEGARYALMGAVVVFSGMATAWVLGALFDIDSGVTAGIYAGALTSTPGLAAAIEAAGSSAASIGYGVAYPFGIVGVILVVKLAPKIARVNVKNEEDDYRREVERERPKIYNRNYVVANPNIFGKTIGSLRIRSMTGATLSRVLKDEKGEAASPDMILREGDVVKAVGVEEALERVRLLVGEETDRRIPLGGGYAVRRILVTDKRYVGKTISEIDLFHEHDATATTVRRSGIDLVADANCRLRFGDRLTVVASEERLKKLGKEFGDAPGVLSQLKLLPISLGVLAGVALGQIEFPLFGASFAPGVSGGVLLASLVLSKIGRTGPIVWNVSGQTNQIVRRLGLIFFLAAVGTSAGENFVETVASHGATLVLVGAAVTVLPTIVALAFGRLVLKMNFLSLLGVLPGAMTSTPALGPAEQLTDIAAPRVAYAAVYPFGMVLVVVACQLLA